MIASRRRRNDCRAGVPDPDRSPCPTPGQDRRDLSYNSFDDDVAAALAASKALAHLERVTITGSSVTDTGASALRTRFGAGVTGP